MNKHKTQNNKGFTLIETLVAVFILSLAINGFLGLISSSLFSTRYAKNEITANYLIQEAVDYIRNDRDSIAFLANDPTLNDGWVNFLNKYGYNSGASPSTCFVSFSSSYGCYLEVSDVTGSVTSCNTPATFGTKNCPVLRYDPNLTNNAFYTYHNVSGSTESLFKRQVIMSLNPTNSDELDIKVTVEWQNGNLLRSRTLQTSLLNWRK